jgi:VRR-NUC domain
MIDEFKPAQPCSACGAETKNKRACPICKHAVTYVAKAKAKPELEQPIKKRIRDAVINAGCLVWIHDVDYRLGKTGLGRGTSDLICIVPPLGRFLGIEVKRPGYSPSDVRDDQRKWLAVVRRFGGVSGIATCEAEALALVAEARQQSTLASAT